MYSLVTIFVISLSHIHITALLADIRSFVHYRSVFHTLLHIVCQSDFHKMAVTVLKMHFTKQKPKIITYRDYRMLSNADFRTAILNSVDIYEFSDIESFQELCINLLNKFAPSKKKYVRANQAPFMNKTLEISF